MHFPMRYLFKLQRLYFMLKRILLIKQQLRASVSQWIKSRQWSLHMRKWNLLKWTMCIILPNWICQY
jgi:hypothetical protein